MATKARIENGIVHEILDLDPFPPFHEDLVWVECGPEAKQGHLYIDGKIVEPVSQKSNEEIIGELTSAIQTHLDSKARERNYDGILSLCSYASSLHPKFSKEGKLAVAWRDECWAKAYDILNDCEAGKRSIPTPEGIVQEMPIMEW